MKEEQVVKMLYGMEISERGIIPAYEKFINNTEKEDEELKKQFKKEFKKDADFVMGCQNADFKLGFIRWSLMCSRFDEVKEALPFLIDEIRKVADELESIK